MWGGPMRRTSELSGCRHHDQQRLLVELELDDSLRSGMEHRDDRRPSSAGAIRHSRHVHPRYDHHNIAEARPRLQSRTPTERQMQQAHAKRLSSPHKLKKQVLGSRHTSTALHASQRVTRSSSLDKSPAQLVVESVQQNIHLRDQVMAHLQQELMGVLPLHRASHVEKNVPQRVVKLLNRMRSLSLAVVEAVVYLSSELGASSMITRSYEHEILEQDFYRYLLQMASSDTEFLACSPQLHRFFEDFDVSLARNPFVDGLSLDSSEVLLCACHQSATSSGLFCSASSSSSSLLKLLTQRLETFALQTQRYLPGWQVLPAARVAAALLHLMDLETRSNAVQMLPRYLQSHSGYRTHIHRPDETSHDYGTFGHDRIQRLDRQDSQAYFRDDESLQSDGSVLEAWTGSPAAKASDGRILHKARASSLADEPQEKNTSKVPTPSSAWTELPSPKDQNSVRSDASRNSTTETDANVASTRLIPLLNTAAIAKSSSSLDKSGSQKKSRTAKATFADARVQMSQLNTPIVAATQTTSRSSSGRSVQEEEGRESSVSVIDVDVVPASNGENLNPVTEPSVLPRDTVEERLNRLVNAIETAVPDECEAEDIREAEPSDDNAYECDFEYSSDSALSSIAMALQMLPDFSLSSTESPRADEVSTLAETVPLIEPQGSAIVLLPNTTASNDYTTPTSTLLELGICVESSRTGRESVDQKVQTPTTQDDEYAYSSSTAISSIAMALSLLPGVSRGDIFSAPDVQVDADSLNTDRSLVSQVEGCSVEADEGLMGEISAISAHSNVSVELITQPIHLLPLAPRGFDLTSERTANSSSVSSRSMLSNLPPSAAANLKADVKEEGSELNRIFSLCRDIQVAAFDMSHWVSQREVEEYIQSAAQPFSCLLGYASPTVQSVSKADNAPKYLERELKMLKRNIASWKRWVVGHKRAKVVVRRLVARRKIRMFVLDHHRRRKQARSYEENRRRLLAATRIQRNWRIFRHYMTVAQRQADFRAVHMTFHRARFFVGISRRRRRREDAKERIVRWWRRQRLLIKKKEQRYERIARERERRTRAFRDIQKFLKEILLRRKLKATQEMTKKILFKEQLKWTKARRDMERTMKLDSKHRIELIADMNARFADLDRKWKASEYERLLLLTHHERVVQQQQQAVEVRKRRLAALKIQMFFRLCLLHEKLQRVEMEKRSYNFKFKEQVLTKEKLDVDSRQRIGKTRTQVRVLERKLDRMSREATHTDAQHRQMLQAHQERERISQERVARQKIKAFMDARTLCRRAERERRRLLLHQTQLQAEKTESEFMSSEDQLEQRRTAVSIACDLQQRLSEMETRSEALQAARNLLAVEKEEQARQAALVLEQSRVQASMHLIASWVSGRVQLSKVHKEQAAIRALAAHDLEQEKRHQRHMIEAKNSEISSIKATNLLHQRISQQRNHKTVELIQIQHKQKAALDKSIAERTRAQLVQSIIQLKLLTERESDRGISLGLASVAQLFKTQVHTFARLKHLRNMNYARRIQRVWRRYMGIKRAQQLALTQLEAKCQAVARRIQVWWRDWLEAQRRREEQRLESIRARVNARKIQRVWRRWVQRERERRQEQQVAFNAHLEVIRTRANARRIQSVWRRWVKREQERRLLFSQHVEAIRRRASARKIQAEWRRWIQGERARRHVQRLAFEAQLKVCRIRANARKIQRVWRRWVLEKKLRARRRAHRAVLSSTVRIQRWWRTWRKTQRVKATRTRILHNACAQVIQKKWREWQRRRNAKRARQRLRIQRECCAKRLQKCWRSWRDWSCRREESAKRIQTRWNKWHKEKQNAERKRKEQTVAATRIQRRWRRRLCRRQYEKEKARKQKQKRETCAVKRIQRVWRCWRKRSVEKAEREQQEKEERAVAARIQHNWTAKLSRRNKQEAERKRHIGAQRIQGNWRRWRRQQEVKRARKREVESQRVSAILFQRTWKKWHEQRRQICAVLAIQKQWRAHHAAVQSHSEVERTQQEDERFQQVEQIRNASSLTIQRTWGLRQHRRKMERQRVQHEQHMAALKIQTLWLKWHHEQEEELERERIRQEQDESSLKIQRSLGISHRRRKVIEMRLRHKQNLNALKIQKHWRRWRYLRLEQRTKGGDAGLQKRKRSSATTAFNQAGYELERQQKLETITERSYGQCIARAVKRYHQSRRQARAATKIEAVWKGWLYRGLYLQAVEAKHAEDVRQYQLLISVLATKVQVCWRQWNVGIRQAKRAAAKSEELRLIQQAKALERKLIAAKRTLAAKRIQRALVSRRRLIATTGVSHRAVVERENEVELETAIDRVEERDAAVQSLIEEHTPTSIESQERNLQELSIGEELEIVEPTEKPTDVSRDEEAQVDVVHSAVESTVVDWSHRQLPHILSRSVNQVLFCHEAATVLQKCVRGHQRRQQMHFHFQHSFATSNGAANHEHFHFYFWRARAWLDWKVAKSSTAETNPNVSILRLRFDELLTRNLLQLFEPSNEYLTSEIQQVLHELASDAWHVVQSPVCMEHITNPRPELRYHDVGELELPLSVKLMQHMEHQHAQLQQLLKVGTSVQERPVTSPRAQNAGTIFTAVETASLEAATFLQQQGADLGALDPKTQRNAFHLLSFSKENHRSRAEVLDFLLTCGATINVNAVDCNGETPLMLYASLGHLEFMQKLLQHGADLRLTNNQGQNVLHRACQQDQVEICGFLQQLMLKDSIAETPIPETMASFVPTALTLHTPDKSGRYPLHYLAGMGFVECAKQLIVLTEANFEWNRLLHAHGDADGRTALHLAVLSHDVAMTAFLLTPGGGCDVHAVDELHRSAVHYAVDSNAALQLMTRLVQHGANVNVADERGDTPLHWAAFAGRATVIQTLLSLGADPTWSNCDWETPAQIAAAYGQLECMRLLLQAQRKAGAAEQEKLKRPASEKTALERLEEAVQELHQRRASMHSFRVDQDASPLVEQAQTGYWEELHQDVQLVEESGQFSSEDEQEFLFD
ncbi:Ankyrin repeats domain-containing protein [Phytophthora infestans]|uniref:Ankyrin repeats domain-containing protein n=1 Tax=Phytophthora infestans TaxID=4787 RepID=A0A8S9UMR2_PHYIN|nr:Ankyrin repeats domain-containing protein [Phytophthora infestans]